MAKVPYHLTENFADLIATSLCKSLMLFNKISKYKRQAIAELFIIIKSKVLHSIKVKKNKAIVD